LLKKAIEIYLPPAKGELDCQ